MRCIEVFGRHDTGKSSMLKELEKELDSSNTYGVLTYGVLDNGYGKYYKVAINSDGDTPEIVENGFKDLDNLKSENIDIYIFATRYGGKTVTTAKDCVNSRAYLLECYPKNKTYSEYAPANVDFDEFAIALSIAEKEVLKAQIFFFVNQKQEQN